MIKSQLLLLTTMIVLIFGCVPENKSKSKKKCENDKILISGVCQDENQTKSDNQKSCGNILHGNSTTPRTRYLTSSVPYGATCIEEEQISTCIDGIMSPYSGSYAYENCTPLSFIPTNCGELNHGGSTSRVMYQGPSVSFNETCISENQTSTCSNGIMSPYSGSFQYESCAVESPPQNECVSGTTQTIDCSNIIANGSGERSRTCSNSRWEEYGGCNLTGCNSGYTSNGDNSSCIVATITSVENLDEMNRRKARRNTNTFYSGESLANNHQWQPMSLSYIDVTSGHEVWIMTNTDNVPSYSGSEYGHQPWSADGKWFSLAIDKNTSAFTRGEFYANEVWFSALSDGSYLRPRIEAPARIRTHSSYTQWSTTIPDIYYDFGRTYAGETGFDRNMLYSVTVSENGISTNPLIDFISGNTSTERDMPKDAISSDNKYVLATAFAENRVVAIGDINSNSLKLPEYNMDRGVDTYWNSFPQAQDDWHDEMFVGGGGSYWIYYLFTTGSWARMRPWGTDIGPPNYTTDRTAPYDWWVGTASQKEIQPVNGKTGVKAFNNNYWSHGVPDRWGNHFAYSDTAGAYVAPGVCNVNTDTRTAFPSSVKGAQYHAWTGWTDYTTGTSGADYIYFMKYNNGETHKHVASIHATTGNQFSKPGQSPDGTKTAFRSDFLQPNSSNGDVFYVVTEYPHPPEITQITTQGANYVIRFDWGLDRSTRGYTTRGWPNETTNLPPAPRETKEFRLWRSNNGSSDWTPIRTIHANSFDKFDYENGGLNPNQTSYWEISDAPGNGTFYYAITSIEHSGLESRTLSNVYSTSNIETTIYPSEAGGDSNFITQYDQRLNKYYNIYAQDGTAPIAIQQNRIASISINSKKEYIDWLGNPDGSTKYRITTVDTQGNESGSIEVNYTVLEIKGQYLLKW